MDVEVLTKELNRLKSLADGGRNFTYARMFHRLADLIQDVTGVDPRA